MKVHLQREIDMLKRQILQLSAEVESDVRVAVKAVDQRDRAAAEAVAQREDRINNMEVDVEEECLKILALHQPVAADLRYIISVLKINSDLERIGDLAMHIADRAMRLCELPALAQPFPLDAMAEKAQLMLKKVLDAFVAMDEQAAREVCRSDREVDDINHAVMRQVKEAIIQDPGRFDALLQVLHIARHLERIADHATNIAEDLIYMIEGRIVRHTAEVAHV
jgi:phosphate transport system protein